jgi:hypothetical protein
MTLGKPSEQEIALAVAAIAEQPTALLEKVGLVAEAVTVAAACSVWGHRVGHLTTVKVEFVDDATLAPGDVLTTWDVRLRRGQVHSVEYTRTVMSADGERFDTLPPFLE